MNKSKDKTISKLKNIEAKFKSCDNKRDLIIKEVKDLTNNIKYSMEFIEELHKLKLPPMNEYKAQNLAHSLMDVHFSELSKNLRKCELPF